MHFNHANFAVADVPAAAAFFARHFGFRAYGPQNDNFIMMQGDGGFVLNFMATGKTEATYHKNFHVGFLIGSVDDVLAKHRELTDAGHAPGEVQQYNRGGPVTTFYCETPGGFLVEVACCG